MLLGHGAIAEHPIASIRGTGVLNVGSAFISGVSMTSAVNDLDSVTGSASVSPSTNVATFSIGTETVTGTAAVDVTTAGQITFSIGDETAFGEAFQNLITFSTGSPDLQIWNQTDDSQSVTWVNVEPGSTD